MLAVNREGEIDVELNWERSGRDDGVPLLLINGLGSPLVSYQAGFVDLLVDSGFQVIRFDNRDVGRSSRLVRDHDASGEAGGSRSVRYTVHDMAADAVAVLDAAGWQSAHVLGQSMGGMIAQQLTIDHPDRVRSLISLMSSTGERGFGQPTKEALAALLETPPADPEGWLEHRVATERIWASPDFWDPEWVANKGREMVAHGVDPAGTARQYRAIQASGSRDEALGSLNTPTLVLHGSADTLIQPTGGQHTADVIPGARYVEIEGMGHDLAPPLWPRLVKEVHAFVAEVARDLA